MSQSDRAPASRGEPSPSNEERLLIPKPGWVWQLAVLIATGLLIFGIYCFVRQVREGLIITNLRNPGFGGAAWGLYIAFDEFFIGVGFAGVALAAVSHVFGVPALRPVMRLGNLLTIASLMAAGCVVLADNGRPHMGLLNLPKYANPRSPFFGTFTLAVSGSLFAAMVYLFLTGRRDAASLAAKERGPLRYLYRLWASGYEGTIVERTRHRRVMFTLSLVLLPLLVLANSTLGFVFGIQSGRPGWFSALQAPGFLVMAGLSGTSMLVLLALGLRTFEHEWIPNATMRLLGNIIWILAIVFLYLMGADELTATYAGPEAERSLAHVVTHGAFAPLFWATVACLFLAFLVPFVLFVRRKTSPALVGVAATFALVAAVTKRLVVVVPSQTHGAMLQIETGSYTPSMVEVGVVLGLVALQMLVVLVFARVFPMVPTLAPVEEPATLPVERGRMFTALSVFAFALGLIIFGLVDSFRLLRPAEIDPVVPFSPVIFANGVMFIFLAIAVYEIYPGSNRASEPNSSAKR